MESLSGFGHVFGYTAVVNFLSSTFKDFNTFLQGLLLTFKVDQLSRDKIFIEQAYSIFQAKYDVELYSKVGGDLDELRIQKAEADLEYARFLKAERNASLFLNEIRYADSYKTNFQNRFAPFFPLAGVYSLIFLIFTAFGEAIPAHSNICFNTMLFVSISTIFVALSNYMGWIYTNGKDVSSRSLILCTVLIGLTIVSWALAVLVDLSNMELFAYTHNIKTIVLIIAVGITFLGFAAIVGKTINVNYLANKKIQEFSHYKGNLEIFLSTTIEELKSTTI